MRTAKFTLLIAICCFANGEDRRYNRSSMFPDKIDAGTIRIVIDTAFSGSHILLLNPGNKTIGRTTISSNGKIDGVISDSAESIENQFKALGQTIKSVGVPKDKIMDGYSIEFTDSSGTIVHENPTNSEEIEQIMEILRSLKVKYIYSKIDGKTSFYPGVLPNEK